MHPEKPDKREKIHLIICFIGNLHYFCSCATAISETAVAQIDIIAENELDRTATFFEVKRKAENIDLGKLEDKAAVFMRATGQFRDYAVSFRGLSMDDM